MNVRLRLRVARRERGQSLVETALILPLFLLLVMGVLDLGRVAYAQHTLAQAVREGARAGQVAAVMSTAKYSAIRNAVRSNAVMTTPTSSDVYGEVGACADVADPTVSGRCFYPDGTDTGDRVVVIANATVELLTPVITSIVGGSITANASVVEFLP